MTKGNNKTQDENIVLRIKEIYEMMLRSGLAEIEVRTLSRKIKIKRIQKNLIVEELPERKVPVQKKVISTEKKEKEEIKGETIKSPLNGVFYIAPSPNSPPFVSEGDVVDPGKVVCIVEAMKVMNEIKVDKKCKILKTLCVNGNSVTTGTDLFLIETV